MNRWKLFHPLMLLMLGLTACTGTLQVNENAAGTSTAIGQALVEAAPRPLNELADQAEERSPLLDVYQISLNDDGDLTVFTFMRRSETSSDSEQDIRRATEGIWDAIMDADLDLRQVSVTFLKTQDVYSLEHGPTQAVWLIGGIRADWSAVADYISGSRTSEAQDSFWNGERILVLPLDQAYVGTPNHPLLRSEE